MTVYLDQVQKFVDFMNSICEIDPEWCQQICETKFNCSVELANHPTVQAWAPTDFNNFPRVGFVGLMNGFFGAYDDGPKQGAGAFCTMYDKETGKFLGFGINENRPAGGFDTSGVEL